ncbi:MAG: ABC transporter permease [Luteolibacter sp.]
MPDHLPSQKPPAPDRWRRWLWIGLCGIPAWVVLMPALVVIFRAWEPQGDAWARIAEFHLAAYLWQTLLLVTLVTGFAVLFGVPAAWLVSVRDFPGRRAFEWLLMLPLAMPGFVAAAAYVDLLGRMIPIYVWVRSTFGIDAFLWVQQITPWVFAVGVLSATLFPYVFLSCRAVFLREAAVTLEAARMLGSGGFRVFATVALPLARPAVVAGASLVAMEAVNDYGVVSYFGLTPLTPGIFRAWGEGHPAVAMRLAVILMGLVLFGLALERWQRGGRRFVSDPSACWLGRKPMGLGGSCWAWVVCGLPLAIGFLVPCGRMATWAWRARDILDWQVVLTAATRSFSMAIGAAAIIVTGAVLLVAAVRVTKHPLARLFQRIGVLGYAYPSALVAVGVGAWISSLNASIPAIALSASAFGLMTAYFIRFLAVGVQPVSAGFEQLAPELQEAARTLGVGPIRALWSIDLRLAWPALLAGATLGFIDVFKELPLTLYLSPFDFETLATLAYRLTDESRIPEAAAPGLLLVICSLLGLIPLTRMMRLASRK